MDINLGVVGEERCAGTEGAGPKQDLNHIGGAECCLAKKGPGDAGHCSVTHLILTCFSHAVIPLLFLNFQ